MLHIGLWIRTYVWTLLESWFSSPSCCSAVCTHRMWPNLLDFLCSKRRIWTKEGQGSNTSNSAVPQLQKTLSWSSSYHPLYTDRWKTPRGVCQGLAPSQWPTPMGAQDFASWPKLTHFFLHRVSGAISVYKAVVFGQLVILFMLEVND